ncbi:outer membrane lipoprotein chaperone LolA [Candidatus Curculioniphilus buchneri]|uniref:outer membrane lipoprotein chaperone LolA n=1 Tax=Candidatus Curculioniphilus buchneri TaxID=690594 RepID=UPI00376F0772
MKKIFEFSFLLLTFITTSALGDDAHALQSRLSQINNFYASFIQQIIDNKGIKVEEGQGELWVKRPNLFNWHIISPNENILISDGKTLWVYNPLLKQVNANWLKNIADNNVPFLLMIRNNIADWKQYNIHKERDVFYLIPKYDRSNLRQFTIQITSNGTIENFMYLDQDNQLIAFQLTHQNFNPINVEKFHFTIPNHVILDDQRQ